jgi:hypothetical protein
VGVLGSGPGGASFSGIFPNMTSFFASALSIFRTSACFLVAVVRTEIFDFSSWPRLESGSTVVEEGRVDLPSRTIEGVLRIEDVAGIQKGVTQVSAYFRLSHMSPRRDG